MLVSSRANKGTKSFGAACAVAQPANNNWQYAEDGLVIGSSLVVSNKATYYIWVMNLSDATRTLHEGTRLGEVFPVELIKQVPKLLWVDSDFSHSDVCAASIAGRNASAKTPRINTCDGANMDPFQKLTRASAPPHEVDHRRYLHSRV